MGIAIRTLVALVAGLSCSAAAYALQPTPFTYTVPLSQGLGLQLSRSLALDCPVAQLVCHSRDASAPLYGQTMFLVGRTQLFPTFGVYGKVGTAYARPDTAVMGNMGWTDPGYGFAYGGGVSWDFSPRVSASLEWGSYDLRLSTGPVRSTSLGLQIRY